MVEKDQPERDAAEKIQAQVACGRRRGARRRSRNGGRWRHRFRPLLEHDHPGNRVIAFHHCATLRLNPLFAA